MLEGVKQNDSGLFEVLIGGKVVACVDIISDAWREYEALRSEARGEMDFTHLSSGSSSESET